MIAAVFIITALLYAGYILFLADGLWKENRKAVTEYSKDKLPFVSVVVAARNEESTLPQLLKRLNQQSYPQEQFEIIIINDRSTDLTENVLQSAAKSQANMQIVSIIETELGWAPKKWALQCGIAESKGEIILQTDADCRPNDNWVQTIVNSFSDPGIGFVMGPGPLKKGDSSLDDLFELDSLAQDSFSAAGLAQGMVFSCIGRNMAFRKTVYEEVSGYEEISHFTSGDDDLLMQKIHSSTEWKIRFLHLEKAVVESDPPASLTQFIHQRLRFASKGLSYYNLKTSKSLKVVLPFLYATNIIIVISIIIFAETANIIWLLPLIIKSIPEVVLTYSFMNTLNRRWSLAAFLMLAILHPFYIVIFGTLGPLNKVKWKQ